MPSSITSQIFRVTVGGPYAYVIQKDGAPTKAATGLATPLAAVNAANADMIALIPGGESPVKITQQLLTDI